MTIQIQVLLPPSPSVDVVVVAWREAVAAAAGWSVPWPP